MATEQFRAMLHQQPFRPFTIHMADGRAVEVAQRDFVAMSPTGRTVIVYQDNEDFQCARLVADVGTAGREWSFGSAKCRSGSRATKV